MNLLLVNTMLAKLMKRCIHLLKERAFTAVLPA